MKLGLIGNYGATNVGDEAILASILKANPQKDWIVFSANPQETVARYGVEGAPLFPFGVRSAIKFGFKRAYRATQKCEAVVMGGGGLFQDDVKMACPLWSYQVLWARSLKKPLYIHGAGVGPLKTPIGKSLTKKVFEYATAISVRDEESRNVLLHLGIDPGKIRVTADPAFVWHPEPHGVFNKKSPTVLVSVRPWSNGGMAAVRTLTEALLELKEKGAQFKYIVMQSIKEGDGPVVAELVKKTGGEVVVPQDFEALLSLMKGADLAIGMRYHFGIAALLRAVPCLLLSYSPKVSSLYENSQMEPYRLKLRGLEEKELKKKIHELWNQAEKNSQILHEMAKGFHARAIGDKILA